MKKYEINSAEYDDVEDICATQIAAIEQLSVDDYTREEISTWTGYITLPHALNILQHEDTDVFVARDNQTMVMGFVTIKNDQITDIYVDPDHIERGIGSALLRRAEWHIRKNGHRTIRLLSTLNSVNFYKNHGYHAVANQEYVLNDDVALDMVEMIKRFTSS